MTTLAPLYAYNPNTGLFTNGPKLDQNDLNQAKTDTVALAQTNIPLSGLVQGGAITGQVLTWSGSAWMPGSVAVTFGTTPGTAAQGNDSRIVNALQPAAIPATTSLLAGSGAAGQATAVTLGTGLSLSGTTLNATGGSGSGSVNAGTSGQLGYYAVNGTTLSGVAVGSGLSLSGGTLSATGSGSGTVGTGTAGALAYYSANGTTLAPLTLGTALSLTGSTLNASVPSASSATPNMDGTATAGTGSNFSRSDHVHPTDTSRLAASAITAAQGSVVFNGSSGPTTLAPGTFGQVLQTNGAGANPTWVTPAGGSSISGVSVSSGTTYAMQTADRIIDVTVTSANAVAITLPTSPTLWVDYCVIDGAQNAGAHNITISAPSGTINGAASFVMDSNADAISLRAVNSTTWRIV